MALGEILAHVVDVGAEKDKKNTKEEKSFLEKALDDYDKIKNEALSATQKAEDSSEKLSEEQDPLEATFLNAHASPMDRIRAAKESGSKSARAFLEGAASGNFGEFAMEEKVEAASALANIKLEEGDSTRGLALLQYMALGEMSNFPNTFEARFLALNSYANEYPADALDIAKDMLNNEANPFNRIQVADFLINKMNSSAYAARELAKISTSPPMEIDPEAQLKAKNLILESVEGGVKFDILEKMHELYGGPEAIIRQIRAADIVALFDPEKAVKIALNLFKKDLSRSDAMEVLAVLTNTGRKEEAIRKLIVATENNLGNTPFNLRRRAAQVIALADEEGGEKRGLKIMQMMLDRKYGGLTEKERAYIKEDIAAHYPGASKKPMKPYAVDKEAGRVYYEPRLPESEKDETRDFDSIWWG